MVKLCTRKESSKLLEENRNDSDAPAASARCILVDASMLMVAALPFSVKRPLYWNGKASSLDEIGRDVSCR